MYLRGTVPYRDPNRNITMLIIPIVFWGDLSYRH